MFFQVTNLDENNVQTNTTKIRANLRNGVTEFLEGHTDMLGRIDNDIVLTESIVEGRTIKKEFLIQSGVLIVSNGGLNPEAPKGTYVLVHSKEIVELTGTIDEKKLNDLVIKLEKKTLELEKELAKINMSLGDLKDAEARNLIFRS
ncbi:MAG: hypothetical protein H7195_06900, partial [Chryseobacterium sp.]|nr:hypothetical protein [Chryseobacterium sp.]